MQWTSDGKHKALEL
ncbi:Protein CBG26230 [Caenorhabditis briggsae]|uniref:Protein CBG26230 n=1 Tax=Caenorhabditis briggsae TaxID=6238 RepID=B6IIY5_CAEBR|nr:Protein CBG26230 [Caenorhabditis briggsae]CAR99865.1 Protein CBG26230 [Caenorhabditis briggsae]